MSVTYSWVYVPPTNIYIIIFSHTQYKRQQNGEIYRITLYPLKFHQNGHLNYKTYSLKRVGKSKIAIESWLQASMVWISVDNELMTHTYRKQNRFSLSKMLKSKVLNMKNDLDFQHSKVKAGESGESHDKRGVGTTSRVQATLL